MLVDFLNTENEFDNALLDPQELSNIHFYSIIKNRMKV